MRYVLITSVIKRQILANSDFTMMSKCRTSDLESTILNSRGLVILHKWIDGQSFIHFGNIVKFFGIS